ncbi:hypothetical protein DERP_005206 [Dermatophagoides pteronyssinus]|uniref:Uncharacterized protein n=1 Tax=Dermatophagoides pteronyssinus TaxID=6956 RepID=A0ABQ8JMU6_DERPT|nr:hypothetical protein DERP_005206 [Dermatophagoides pteronyssinus]
MMLMIIITTISILITKIYSLNSMAVNVNVVQPLNRTAVIGDMMTFNISLIPDTINYNKYSGQNSLWMDDKQFPKSSLSTLESSTATKKMAKTFDEQQDDPDKFIKYVLQKPLTDDGKQTDVIIKTNHYDNGYGLRYGFDLDGKYVREKGYKFEKMLGKEFCKDQKSCTTTEKIERRDDNSDDDDQTPDTALKKHILQLIRHNNSENKVNLDEWLNKKQRKNKSKKRHHHSNKNNNKHRNNKRLKNSQNYFDGPFTKLDSLQIKSSPLIEENHSSKSFYYPKTTKYSPNIYPENYGKILHDSTDENRPHESSDIMTMFKWTNPPTTSTSSNVYFPHKIIHLSDDELDKGNYQKYWQSSSKNFPKQQQQQNNSDLQQELSEVKSHRLKMKTSRISNHKIHHHWFINPNLINESNDRQQQQSQLQQLQQQQPQQQQQKQQQTNELKETKDFSISNNYQNSIFDLNFNPYSKKFIKKF